MQTVSAARALARRGVSLSVARRAVERLAEGCATTVIVPRMDGEAMVQELAGLKIRAAPLGRLPPAALRTVRRALSMSQDQFANAYGLEPRTVQNWERKSGELDPAVSLLVKVISAHPRLVEAVAAETDLPHDEAAG